jgi:hypothetical protein
MLLFRDFVLGSLEIHTWIEEAWYFEINRPSTATALTGKEMLDEMLNDK